MAMRLFQFRFTDLKLSLQSTQLIRDSRESLLDRERVLASCFAPLTPKTYSSRIQFDQATFIIGRKPKATEALN
ncbi:MAG: hypothetical protein DME80_01420 [Verrucomicrobia bacterium]|nr:MAG: hypothetical protein DME80_01420 [Verrucomicrobiota bacterium]